MEVCIYKLPCTCEKGTQFIILHGEVVVLKSGKGANFTVKSTRKLAGPKIVGHQAAELRQDIVDLVKQGKCKNAKDIYQVMKRKNKDLRESQVNSSLSTMVLNFKTLKRTGTRPFSYFVPSKVTK